MTSHRITELLDATSSPHAAQAAIARAADLLRSGGTVAFPTETVYGLAADAFRPGAVARIFAAKGRPAWDPLIVHVSDRTMLEQVAIVPPAAEALIAAFWPGPLTLLLPRTSRIPDAVTAGRPLVGVRMPSHPLALALLQAAGIPLAAPSANRFGHTSPTTAAHVLDDLDHRIDAILDGGATPIGIESTVLDPNQSPMVIYRPGAITPAMIQALVGDVVLYQPPSPGKTDPEPGSLPSPGVGIRHYAPRATLLLVEDQAELAGTCRHLTRAGERVGIMLPLGWTAPPGSEIFPWQPWGEGAALAQHLFLGLRALDAAGVSTILCPLPAAQGIGVAIRDRLEKAAREK